MSPEIEHLISLQRTDREIQRLKAEIAELPKRVAAIEQKLAGLEQMRATLLANLERHELKRKELLAHIDKEVIKS